MGFCNHLQQAADSEGIRFVQKMDGTNVPYAVIFGMGMAKQWDEHAPAAPTN